MAENAVCRLCHSLKPLRWSHIVPEFLYSSMYDDKHRFQVLSTNQAQKNHLAQKGARERLLCEDCEQRLSKWERYASLVLSGGTAIVAVREGNLWHLSELNYSSLKLFQLSVLWRASVSTIDFFSNVSLGKHEEKIRKLLLSADPGLPWQYGCVMCGLVADEDETILTDLMIQPDRLKLHGHNAYRFVFGGFMWVYLTSSHAPPAPIRSAILSPDGNLSILVKKVQNAEYLRRLAIELFERGKV